MACRGEHHHHRWRRQHWQVGLLAGDPAGKKRLHYALSPFIDLRTFRKPYVLKGTNDISQQTQPDEELLQICVCQSNIG